MVCVGNSHLACVLLAARAQGKQIDAVVLKESRYFGEIREGIIVLNSTKRFPKEAVEMLAQGPVFSFIGGTRHISLGATATPEPLDFVLPDDPDLPLDGEAEIVPANAIRAYLTRRIRRYLRKLEELRDVATGPVYHFDAPPPPPHEWFLDIDDPRRAAKRGRLNQVRLVRYKLWRLHSDIVRERAERIGVTFVPCPAAALGDHCLRPEFIHNGSHANEAYGALVLEQMTALA